MRTTILALLLLGAAPAAAAPVKPARAAAARSTPARGHGQSLSLWGVLDPGPVDGVGVGGRFTLPIVPQGFLRSPTVRDELALELGMDFVHYRERVGSPYYVDYSWNGLLAVGGVAWNLWFTPRFAAYPKIDLGWWFGWYRGWDGYGRRDFAGVFLQGAAGLIYRFDSAAFRLELGSDLVRIGIAFPI